MKKVIKARFAVWLVTMYCLAQVVFGAWLSVDVIPDKYSGAKLIAAFVLICSDIALIATVIAQFENDNS